MSSEQKEILAKVFLTPLAYAYKLGVDFRNMLFNRKFLKQHEINVPVVVVGNLAVGGTGKTPHTEYIVRMLCGEYHIGVLSRGYKRKTSGFVLGSENLTADDLGDEPYQIYRKYGEYVTLAVCESRFEGIKKMYEIDPEINLFVLDDAYQHRYVKPKVAVLLTEYNKLPCDDHMLPLGNLREPAYGMARADVVVVTKCPEDLKPIDVNVVKKKLNLSKWQEVFFSTYKYGQFVPIFNKYAIGIPDINGLTPQDTLLVFTGVANSLPMAKYLKRSRAKVKLIHFNDHHDYTREDFEFIKKTFNSLDGERKFLITTEKDAVKILNNPYVPHTMKQFVFYLPVQVVFFGNEKETGEEAFLNKLKELISKQ